MGKGTNTTTNQTTSAPAPQAAAAYNNLLTQAGNVASTPYQAYTGQLTAPVNSQQQAGIGGINASANFAQNPVNQAIGIAGNAANPLTQQQIQQYQNPYTQDVVNATQAQFNNQNAQQQAGVTGNAISQGALGGNRVGVAQANLAGQQQLAQAPVIAGLYNQSYQQGLSTAENQFQQNPLAAAGSLANFGISGQGAALSGAGAQLGAGTLEQQTQQAQDAAAYQQYAQQQAYPFQTTQWLAGLDTGVGSQLGGTSSGQTTGPAPNQTAQYAGLGLAAAGLFLNRGGRVERANGGVVPQHMDSGGVSGTPWSQGVGWVPSMNIHAGTGAPHASAPSVAAQPAFDANAFAKQIVGLGGGTSGGGLQGTSATADHLNDYLQDTVSGDAAPIGDYFTRGGVVGYADGGGIAPRHMDDGGIVAAYPYSADDFQRLSPLWSPRTPSADARANASPEDLATASQIRYDRYRMGHDNPGVSSLGRMPSAFVGSEDTQNPIPTTAYARGGGAGYAGGGPPDGDTFLDRFAPAVEQPMGVMPRGEALGLAGLGTPTSRGIAPQPVPGSQGAPTYDDGQGAFRLHPDAVVTGDKTALKGTGVPSNDDSEADEPPAAQPTSGRGTPSGVAPAAGFTPPYQITPADYAPPARDTSSGIGFGLISPNAKSGLLSAGLGMLASRSPFLGNALGEAGLTGLSAYGSAEEKDRKAAEEAQKLSLEAKQAANAQALSTWNANHKGDMSDYQEAEIALEKQKLAQGRWKVIREAVDPDTGLMKKTYGQIDDSGKPIGASSSPAPTSQPPQLGADGKPVTGEDWAATVPAPRADRARMIANYEETPADLPTRGGVRAAAVADAKHFNKDYNEQNYAASQRAYNSFVSGQEAKSVRSLNVATDHLDTLRDAATALKNGQYPLLNALVNKAREATGSPVTTNFDSIKQAVSSEIAKVVVGGQTALADRDEMANRARNADSPEQLYGIFDQFTKLMGGQMKGLKQQYETGTYRKDFEKFLLPSTKKSLASVSKDVDATWEKPSFAPPAGAIPQTHNGKTYYYDPQTKQPYPGQ